jgi:hypothetical protein
MKSNQIFENIKLWQPQSSKVPKIHTQGDAAIHPEEEQVIIRREYLAP